jgi:putative transcriptional regulator
MVLALVAPSTAAEEQRDFATRSDAIDSKVPTLSTGLSLRRATMSGPRSPRPPDKPAAGTLLIAQHTLRDPNFAKSVILLAEYSAEGALGLIVNRPSTLTLADALAEAETLRGRSERLYAGGPVQRNQIFLLIESQQPPAEGLPIFGNLYMSASAETLKRLVGETNPGPQFRAYAGYAGWGAGQLDAEIDRGDWQLWWADVDTVFSDQDVELWQRLLRVSTQRWVLRRLDPEERALSSKSRGMADPFVAILTTNGDSMSLKVPNLVSKQWLNPRP